MMAKLTYIPEMVQKLDPDVLDVETLKEIAEASTKLQNLLDDLGVEAGYLIHDWKDSEGHFDEVAKAISLNSQLKPGWTFRYFAPWHDFDGNSGDDHVSILSSKPVSVEDAEKIALLVYIEGAYLPCEFEVEKEGA